MEPQLRHAVDQAVKVVNAHQGETCVHVTFAGEPEIDFVANSARLDGEAFEFRAGFETLAGRVAEVAAIRAEVIGH